MHIIEAEISYDLMMEDELDFVEGTYRLPGGDWQVFVTHSGNVPEVEVKPQVWDSGIRGVVIHFPLKNRKLNRTAIEAKLSDYFDTQTWKEVRGPDSIQLR
jgi:hypothetical protein